MVNVTVNAQNNIQYTLPDGTVGLYNNGDVGFMLISTFQVFLMTFPGLALFYSGLGRAKSAVSLLWIVGCSMCMSLLSFFLFGFSLAFSPTGSPFIRDARYFGLAYVDIEPSTGSSSIFQLLYCLYQSAFASITCALAAGSFEGRARLLPVLVWSFLWTIIVYGPIAAATWNIGSADGPPGFLNKLGVLDFAGGPVHMNAGFSGLAISVFLGKRRGYGTEQLISKPHNLTSLFVGTTLLTIGWMGFDGGSELAANLRACMATLVTINGAVFGGFTWLAIDYFHERKVSMVAFCSGCITGLVAVTPASGYIGFPASLAIAFVGTVAANYGTAVKHLIGVDDSLDIFASHGICAASASLLTGVFADSRVASFDGSSPLPGGWINKHWMQVPIQLAEIAYIPTYAFTVTMILLFIIDRIPGLHFRVSEEDELIGIDLAQMDEVEMTLARHFIEDLEKAETPLETTPMLEKQDAHSSPSGSESEHKENLEQPTSEIREAMA